jgi:two-component system sensor histidine kinase KdpD
MYNDGKPLRNSKFVYLSIQYILAFGIIAVVTALLFSLREALDTTLIALLYLIPLGLITSYWGLGPGIASAVLTFLAFNYFFIPPYYNFLVHRPTDVVILVMFLIVAIVFSQLVGRMKAGLAAATAREREATQLYELSTALGGLQDGKIILETLAKQVHDVSNCEAVEINTTGTQPAQIHLPPSHAPNRHPELVLPLQLAHILLGEIRVWRAKPTLTPGEKRILQTFASQGALALERARLAQAEARSKIIEESDRLKSAILSSVSHELRTPLSTIKAASSSLRSNEVDWNSPARPELIAAIDD